MTSTTKMATTGDETCTHNTVTHTGVPARAWKCANCGYIYGDALQPPEHDAGLRDDERCLKCGRTTTEIHRLHYLGGEPTGCNHQWAMHDDRNGQSDTGQPEREWTASEFDGNLDGYPLLSPEGLAAIATDPEYQARILVSVNSHASLVAALERTQRFLLLLTDAGVLDQIAAEHSHPDEVNGLCDAVDEALKHARERE